MNQYTNSIKKDKQRSTNARLEGQGTSSLWKTVRQIAHQRIPGPLSLLKVGDEMIRSPLHMATTLNNFYKSKVDKIRAGFSHPILDAAKGLRQILVARKTKLSVSDKCHVSNSGKL